ncbi:MAG: hypothetical protein AABY88_10740 [Pseudomonadota bacterium]
MVNERAAGAISRIERALVRIESAAIASQRSGDASLSRAQLEQRHAGLRQELQVTLGDIDQIIAQSEKIQD